jgi:hypothetical protein
MNYSARYHFLLGLGTLCFTIASIYAVLPFVEKQGVYQRNTG